MLCVCVTVWQTGGGVGTRLVTVPVGGGGLNRPTASSIVAAAQNAGGIRIARRPGPTPGTTTTALLMPIGRTTPTGNPPTPQHQQQHQYSILTPTTTPTTPTPSSGVVATETPQTESQPPK